MRRTFHIVHVVIVAPSISSVPSEYYFVIIKWSSKQRKLSLSSVKHEYPSCFLCRADGRTACVHMWRQWHAGKSDVVFYCTRVYTAQYRYDPTTRPVKDDNTTITANVAISLYHILDMVSRADPAVCRCLSKSEIDVGGRGGGSLDDIWVTSDGS